MSVCVIAGVWGRKWACYMVRAVAILVVKEFDCKVKELGLCCTLF